MLEFLFLRSSILNNQSSYHNQLIYFQTIKMFIVVSNQRSSLQRLLQVVPGVLIRPPVQVWRPF